MQTNPKNFGSILLVDDEKNVLDSYEITLNSAGIENLILCSKSMHVEKIIEDKIIELILLDLTMPEISGEEILKMVTSRFPEIPVIIITGNKKDCSIAA